jgi:hypothetical protein
MVMMMLGSLDIVDAIIKKTPSYMQM